MSQGDRYRRSNMLTKEQELKGFNIVEKDDHILELRIDSVVIDTYSQIGASMAYILRDIRKYELCLDLGYNKGKEDGYNEPHKPLGR